MIIKEINILQNNIEIKEEKKGIWGIKTQISRIDIESIDKIERILKNNELIGIALWHENDILHAIGIKNYEKNLEDLYNKILSNTKKNFVKVIETKL